MALLCFSFAQDKYVAVMTLEPMGLTEVEANILSERLTNKLVSLKKYIVIERSNVDKIMKEQKFQYSGCTNNQCAVKIGELLNSNYIIIGSVSKFGTTYSIDARMIDVETSEVVDSAIFSDESGKIDVLLSKGIDHIAMQLYSEQISETVKENLKIPQVADRVSFIEEKFDNSPKRRSSIFISYSVSAQDRAISPVIGAELVLKDNVGLGLSLDIGDIGFNNFYLRMPMWGVNTYLGFIRSTQQDVSESEYSWCYGLGYTFDFGIGFSYIINNYYIDIYDDFFETTYPIEYNVGVFSMYYIYHFNK